MTQKAALVVIGNEILSGRTQEKNIHYIASRMTKYGVPLAEVRVVPDIEGKIIEALNALRGEYDYVFTTGGIGPTHDDITAASVAKAFGVEFERHEDAYQVLLDYYGAEELSEARASMADMPRGVTLIPNPVSGAPGFRIENVFVMAGVPRIMQAMLTHVLQNVAPGDPVFSNAIRCDLQESVVAQKLGEIQVCFKSVDIGSYPRFREKELSVNIVISGTDKEVIAAATKAVLALVEECGGEVQAQDLQVALA